MTRIHDLFRRFDVNKDGHVSKEEFAYILGPGGLQYSGKVRACVRACAAVGGSAPHFAPTPSHALTWR